MMAVRRKPTLAAIAAVLAMLCLRSGAWARDVLISGPGGESAASHTAPQVQVWSCNGRVHDCHISQSGKAVATSHPNKDVAAVLPKFKPRVARRSRARR